MAAHGREPSTRSRRAQGSGRGRQARTGPTRCAGRGRTRPAPDRGGPELRRPVRSRSASSAASRRSRPPARRGARTLLDPCRGADQNHGRPLATGTGGRRSSIPGSGLVGEPGLPPPTTGLPDHNGQTVNGLVDDAELEWSDDRKVRFIAGNVVDALAPTNFAWSNPEALKRTVEAGGLNFVKGARRFARDVSRSPRLPANVNADEFALGRNIALSPGAVVVRDERFELIQYQATCPEVREVPLLIIPPMINKFYIADLAPGRSRSVRVPGEPRATGVHHLVAESRRASPRLGTRQLRRGGDGRARRDRRYHGRAARACDRQLRGRDARIDGGVSPRRRRRAGPPCHHPPRSASA